MVQLDPNNNVGLSLIFDLLVQPPRAPLGWSRDSWYETLRERNGIAKNMLAKMLSDVPEDAKKIPVAVFCSHYDKEPCAVCVKTELQRIDVSELWSDNGKLIVYLDCNSQQLPGLKAFTSYFNLVSEYPDRRHTHVFPRYEHKFNNWEINSFKYQQRFKKYYEWLWGSSKYSPKPPAWWDGISVISPTFTGRELGLGLPQMYDFVTALRSSAGRVKAGKDQSLAVEAGYLDGMTHLRAVKVISLVMLLEVGLLLSLAPPVRRRFPFCQRVTPLTGGDQDGWSRWRGKDDVQEQVTKERSTKHSEPRYGCETSTSNNSGHNVLGQGRSSPPPYEPPGRYVDVAADEDTPDCEDAPENEPTKDGEDVSYWDNAPVTPKFNWKHLPFYPESEDDEIQEVPVELNITFASIFQDQFEKSRSFDYVKDNRWYGDGQKAHFWDAIRNVWQTEDILDLAKPKVLSYDNSCLTGLHMRIWIRNEPEKSDCWCGRGFSHDHVDLKHTLFSFYYMPVSLDPELLQHWSEIVAKIMQAACLETSDYKLLSEEIIEILENGKDREDVWIDLLVLLGLGRQVNFWRKQLQRYQDGENSSFYRNGLMKKL